MHSLLELEMVRLVLELSLKEPNLVDRLWPLEEDSNEKFTVFGFSNEEFRRLDDLLPSSDVTQALMGHVVDGIIYSSTIKRGDVITPILGNFSLHVSTIGSSPTKVVFIVLNIYLTSLMTQEISP